MTPSLENVAEKLNDVLAMSDEPESGVRLPSEQPDEHTSMPALATPTTGLLNTSFRLLNVAVFVACDGSPSIATVSGTVSSTTVFDEAATLPLPALSVAAPAATLTVYDPSVVRVTTKL